MEQEYEGSQAERDDWEAAKAASEETEPRCGVNLSMTANEAELLIAVLTGVESHAPFLDGPDVQRVMADLRPLRSRLLEGFLRARMGMGAET